MHVHWMHFVTKKGINSYYQCRCGKRKVKRGNRGYSPVDDQWLRGGGWTVPPRVGPRV